MKQKTCAEILAETGDLINSSPVLKAACIYSDNAKKPSTMHGHGKVGLIEAFKAGAEWQSNQIFTEFPPMDTPVVLVYGDGGEDDCDIGHYTGLNYVNKMGQQVDEHVIGWIPIPKFNA